MNILIHLHYRDRTQTTFALAAARQLQKAGHSFTLLSRGTRARHVDSDFDNRVLSHKKHEFSDLVKQHDAVIFCDPPPVGFIEFAKESGVKTIVGCFWEDIVPNMKAVFKAADVVFAPIIQAELLLRNKWELPKIFYWPIDPAIPTFKKTHKIEGNLKVLFPVCGSAMSQIGIRIFECIEEIAKVRKTDITLLTNSHFSEVARKATSYLVDKYQIKVIEDPTRQVQIREYLHSDISVRALMSDGCGASYLYSVCCGTPVVTHDAPPVHELPGIDQMSVVVNSEHKSNELGVVIGTPSYTEITTTINNLAANKAVVEDMRVKIPNYDAYLKLSEDGMVNCLES